MVAKQGMMEAITQASIEAAKASIIADREAENVVNAARSVQVIS